MSTVTVFTSMTNPDERKDPWKQALNCYEDLADEINICLLYTSDAADDQ